MDQIFDRFGRMMKSWFADTAEIDEDYADTDIKDAWEELEDYLKSDGFRKAPAGQVPTGSGSAVPENLRKDYENLGAAFGADIEEVKKAYKRTILKYHPDRVGQDPESQKNATRKAASINESFCRIEKYFEN